MLKIAVVINEPPPYRIPIFNRIAIQSGIQLQVIFCCRREPNREWDLPTMLFPHVFLRERITTVNGRYIHNNPDVLLALSRFRPDVVVGNGFNPTHLYAIAWCRLMRRPYVPMTDGTLQSERHLSHFHLAVRRHVYRRAPAFIAASQGGLDLYRHHEVPAERCHLSCLCVDNDRFKPRTAIAAATFDLLFCGRLEPGKNPMFAIDVALHCARRLGRTIRLLIVGSGSLEADIRRQAIALSDHVDVCVYGFAAQADLPRLYQSARLFLFPTQADVWGVVANEACAAGLPVIVSPYAGVAGELIVDGQNGYVRALDVDLWAETAATLLNDEARRSAFGQRSLLKVACYHFDAAAQGIVEACQTAITNAAGTGPQTLAQARASTADRRDQRPMI